MTSNYYRRLYDLRIDHDLTQKDVSTYLGTVSYTHLSPLISLMLARCSRSLISTSFAVSIFIHISRF